MKSILKYSKIIVYKKKYSLGDIKLNKNTHVINLKQNTNQLYHEYNDDDMLKYKNKIKE